jgi:hypothetical protein
MLIDKYLPFYHFREFHSIKLHGFFDGIYQSMLQTDFGNSRLIKMLFKIRGMGASTYSIGRLPDLGFIKLHEEPGKEILFGRVTDSPTFSTCQADMSAEEFIKRSGPSDIKAVISFKLQQVYNAQHIISTETRVWCGSKALKSKFGLYWFFIKPFSQLIRKSMLRQMRREICIAK